MSGVAVFFASFLAWVAIGHHKPDWRELPAEQDLCEQLRRSGLTPGRDIFPLAQSKEQMADPSKQRLVKSGPWGTINYWPAAPNQHRQLLATRGRGPRAMTTFDFRFSVTAPVEAVAAFHFQPGILKLLTPPLMIMQVHRFEPLAEGSVAEFTMWLGPIPVFWKAVHSDVSAQGFTDTQTVGPMKSWRHQHRFIRVTDNLSEVHDHIEFEHFSGRRGIWSRLLFPRLGLRALFTIRMVITRRAVARRLRDGAGGQPPTPPDSAENIRR